MRLEVLTAIVSVFSICTFIGGTAAWYSANIQKRYAAQRDFEHLKRNYQQLAQNQATILEVLDKRFDSLALDTHDVRQKLNVIMIKVLPEQSTGWMNQKDLDKG